MASPLDNNELTIRTVQIAPFRTLMTALKDILLETNILFDKDGIKIINTTNKERLRHMAKPFLLIDLTNL